MINAAVVAAIKDSTVPSIDKEELSKMFGTAGGELLSAQICELVREAAKMSIEWDTITLEEGVDDILWRFHDRHPELSTEALHEIGRCVGWNLR